MIVCGTDLSENARPGLRAAAALSARLGDRELWVVHVVDPSPAKRVSSAERDPYEATVAERLSTEVQHLRDRFDSSHIRSAVLAGLAGNVLTEFAETKHAGLLVVASQGHGASPLYRLGGTSERVVVASRVPVLVVRDSSPFEAWARGERPLRIVVGVDLAVSSTPALRLVEMLKSHGACVVVVAHVYYASEVSTRYGVSPLGSWVEPDAPTEELLARDLATHVGDLCGDGSVTFRPKLGLGRMGDHLLEFAESEKADLIVVGTHQRRGLRRLGSVSSVVLHFGHTSVACIPANGILDVA